MPNVHFYQIIGKVQSSINKLFVKFANVVIK